MQNSQASQNVFSVPLRKIKTAMTYPGAFFRYKASSVRGFYHNFSRLAHFDTYAKRCNDSMAQAVPDRKLSIDDKKGYALFGRAEFPPELIDGALAEIRTRIAGMDIDEVRKTAEKPYLLFLMKSADIKASSPIFKLITHPSIVGAVARYLGCVPLLTYVSVWYSPNLPGEQKGSQKFHLDHEDYRQIKGFMFVEDIGTDNGPFTLLPADESAKVQKGIGYKMTPGEKQIEDETAYRHANEGTAVPLVGPAGTVGLVDTSRCFHYGSREAKNPRILLAFQYMTPFAYVMPWKWQKNKLFPHMDATALLPLERKVLGLDI